MTPQKTDLKRMQKALDKAISTSDVDAIQKASRDLVIYHQSKGETEMCVVMSNRYCRILDYLVDLVN